MTYPKKVTASKRWNHEASPDLGGSQVVFFIPQAGGLALMAGSIGKALNSEGANGLLKKQNDQGVEEWQNVHLPHNFA